LAPRRAAPAGGGEPGPLTLTEAAPLLAPYLRGGRASGVVLAVSGGPDSVALMRFSAALRPAGGAPLVVATVDHGLRPESGDEAEAVAEWARACGLPHRTLSWTGAKPSIGGQAEAREARYQLLAGFAREARASHVLTAHHGDDQAETILMRLCRGSGPSGLVGMDRETVLHGVTVARPFFPVRKARLVAACRAEGWPFLDDPSNADPRFARTRVRRLLDLAEAEGLSPERLSRLALRLRRWEEVVERAAGRAFATTAAAAEDGRVVLDGVALLREPEEVIGRVLSRAVEAVAGYRRRPRLERLEGLAEALTAALGEGGAFRANLGGVLVDAGPDGRVVLRPEPPRRRRPRASARPDAAGVPHSLGTRDGRA
jgi:tRNA(Ile)-lysidine synthase